MELLCPKCGGRVSDSTKQCVRCGQVRRPHQSPKGQKPLSDDQTTKSHRPPAQRMPRTDGASLASLVGALLFAVLMLVGYMLTSGSSYKMSAVDVARASSEAKANESNQQRKTKVSVTVSKTRSNGHAWDGLSNPPDLALCLLSNGRSYCEPNAESPATVSKPRCKDSLKCNFKTIQIPTGQFMVVVIDVDSGINETVGSGFCRAGMKCQLGDAQVMIAHNPRSVSHKVAAGKQVTPSKRKLIPVKRLQPEKQAKQIVAGPKNATAEPNKPDNNTLFRLLNPKANTPASDHAHIKRFTTLMGNTRAGKNILNAAVYQVGKIVHSDVLVITMNSKWHQQAKKQRLKHAQKIWEGWAGINSPDEPSRSYVWLDDTKGRRVGGSRIVNGSVIWVQ